MNQLVAPYLEKRISFELFKSNVCHRLNALGNSLSAAIFSPN